MKTPRRFLIAALIVLAASGCALNPFATPTPFTFYDCPIPGPGTVYPSACQQP